MRDELDVRVFHPETGIEVARTVFDLEDPPIQSELDRMFPGHRFEFRLHGRLLSPEEAAYLLSYRVAIKR